MASNGWFLELLDHERMTFDDDAYPLPKHQKDAFELCCELLKKRRLWQIDQNNAAVQGTEHAHS